MLLLRTFSILTLILSNNTTELYLLSLRDWSISVSLSVTVCSSYIIITLGRSRSLVIATWREPFVKTSCNWEQRTCGLLSSSLICSWLSHSLWFLEFSSYVSWCVNSWLPWSGVLNPEWWMGWMSPPPDTRGDSKHGRNWIEIRSGEIQSVNRSRFRGGGKHYGKLSIMWIGCSTQWWYFCGDVSGADVSAVIVYGNVPLAIAVSLPAWVNE